MRREYFGHIFYMNIPLPLILAKRYLISKKSHNAINIITLISFCGVAVITTALICALSVFNGFQSLIAELYSAFDPELRIQNAKSKAFNINDDKIQDILLWPEIEVFSEILEENALVGYKDRQLPVLVKGVSDNFNRLTSIDDIVVNGEFILNDSVVDYATLGVGIASQLGVNAGFITPLAVYMPKRDGKINITNLKGAFREGRLFVSSVFCVNQAKYDDLLLLAPLEFVRNLYGDRNAVTSIEIKVAEGYSKDRLQKKIKDYLGSDYVVLNRMEQQADTLRIMQIEKWITFLILVFILMIATFNVIGSLSMIIVDKKDDINTLRNLGASNQLIKRIFYIEGWMISGIGAVLGILAGALLCWLQETFGIITLGNSTGTFIVDAYPVKLLFTDCIYVVIAVALLGSFSSIYPVKVLSGK